MSNYHQSQILHLRYILRTTCFLILLSKSWPIGGMSSLCGTTQSRWKHKISLYKYWHKYCSSSSNASPHSRWTTSGNLRRLCLGQLQPTFWRLPFFADVMKRFLIHVPSAFSDSPPRLYIVRVYEIKILNVEKAFRELRLYSCRHQKSIRGRRGLC